MFQIYTAKPNACAGRRNGNNKSTVTSQCFRCHIIFISVCAVHIKTHACCPYTYFVRISEDKPLPFTINRKVVDPSGHVNLGVGMRPLACWDCGFEYSQRHEYLSLVSVVCCQVEDCVSG